MTDKTNYNIWYGLDQKSKELIYITQPYLCFDYPKDYRNFCCAIIGNPGMVFADLSDDNFDKQAKEAIYKRTLFKIKILKEQLQDLEEIKKCIEKEND